MGQMTVWPERCLTYHHLHVSVATTVGVSRFLVRWAHITLDLFLLTAM